MNSPPKPADEADLARFGYAQSLGRTLGGFSSFAAGFAYISILTGLFQTVHIGYREAGPAFVWTWPVVALGQFCVALCFAELSAHYPLCGSVYQWSKGVAGGMIGWLAGWVSLAGSVVALAAVSMALQASLPAISPIFQVVGSAANPEDSARNAVVLGAALIVVTTLLNARGVNLLATINNLGVLAELIGAALLVVLLFAVRKHPPQVVLSRSGGAGGDPWAGFLAAALTASYVLYGFETAGSLAEETVNPRKQSPRAILLALASAAVVGMLLLLTALMAASDPHDPALGRPDGGLARIATEALGPGLGRVFLAIVAIAIGSCALTVHAGAVRLVYAMARDGLLPASGVLSKVGGASKTPTGPAVVVGLVAAAILLVNLNHPQVVESVTCVSIVWINLSYLLVTVPLLRERLRGWPKTLHDDFGGRLFRLGRWGVPINALAVVWGLVIVTNTGWPRAVVYGSESPGRFIAPLGTLALLAIGVCVYNASGRRGQTMEDGPRQEAPR